MKKGKFSLNFNDEILQALVANSDHRTLGLWAADCVERVLPYFENEYPQDARPRAALVTLENGARQASSACTSSAPQPWQPTPLPAQWALTPPPDLQPGQLARPWPVRMSLRMPWPLPIMPCKLSIGRTARPTLLKPLPMSVSGNISICWNYRMPPTTTQSI